MNPFELFEKENFSFGDGGIVEIAEKPPKAPEKWRECPICHVSYKYGNSYWQHVRYVHASSLVQCVVCEKCYKRTTMAKHHVLHSHKIAWHLCGNYIRKIRKSELQQQKQGTDNESSGNQIKSEPPQIIRRKILHLIRSFNCYNCEESYSTIGDLFEHVRVHKGEQEVEDNAYETDDSIQENEKNDEGDDHNSVNDGSQNDKDINSNNEDHEKSSEET